MSKNKEKINAARALYLNGGYTQEDIARMLGISGAAITKAKKEEGWDEELEIRDASELTSRIREKADFVPSKDRSPGGQSPSGP